MGNFNVGVYDHPQQKPTHNFRQSSEVLLDKALAAQSSALTRWASCWTWSKAPTLMCGSIWPPPILKGKCTPKLHKTLDFQIMNCQELTDHVQTFLLKDNLESKTVQALDLTRYCTLSMSLWENSTTHYFGGDCSVNPSKPKNTWMRMSAVTITLWVVIPGRRQRITEKPTGSHLSLVTCLVVTSDKTGGIVNSQHHVQRKKLHSKASVKLPRETSKYSQSTLQACNLKKIKHARTWNDFNYK
jgi:hypothetical protein